MKSKSLVLTIAVVVAIGAIVAVLGIELSGESESPAIEVQPGYYEEPTEIFTMPEQTTSWWQSIFEEETEPATEASTVPAQSTTLTEKVTEAPGQSII